jgi:hypothetical protein
MVAAAAIAVFAVVASAVSVAAASAARAPAAARSGSLSFDVHFSPPALLHLNPNPDPSTGVGPGDEITFHDQLFSHGNRAGDEGGSCVIVDGAQALANCTMVIRLRHGTITAQFLNAPPPRKELAVTGGSGIYRNAGGEGTLVEFGNGTGRLTLHLLRFAEQGR